MNSLDSRSEEAKKNSPIGLFGSEIIPGTSCLPLDLHQLAEENSQMFA